MERDGFWQNMMGIGLLVLVAFVSIYAEMLAKPENTRAAEAAVRQAKAEERPVVVIDAGHGGRDPGKIGVSGQEEKDINLQIAARLKGYLEASDVTVVMTRDEDIGLYSESDSHKKAADMENRTRLIDSVSPNLAVSIHQNSYHQEDVSGPQMFYYTGSEKGERLAEILQESLQTTLQIKGKGRAAKANNSYYLLLNVKAPMVIAECGFLSNPSEAALLSEEEYQDRVAWALHMGIMQYLNQEG